MTSPRTLLAAWNIRAKKQLGQNFLTDPFTAARIIARCGISTDDIVLEIGAGLGAMTIPLARIARTVYAVEIDPVLIKLLKTELATNSISNVNLMEKNILRFDILEFSKGLGRRIVVMGNLPYGISSQILVKLIYSRKAICRAFLMFQKELAQRISAQPGGKDYGRLTVMLKYCAQLKTLTTVSSSLFFPKPKVDSEVLEIQFRHLLKRPARDEEFFFQVVKAAFGRRRKTLKNALAGSDLRITGDTALRALDLAGVDPMRRAETLQVSEFVSLSNCLSDILAKTSYA
ncbi:MAG: 16S rRNA (adenine(1518)-N(6)/adenine(1519)-N(6))-dimethyltransferase RsmA [Desulfobacterales bacterium]|jgi:16S rRNA (adenine1518-N6/adenine1519-N6)-dimethyltransferase